MTDEDVGDLLRILSSKRFAAWQKGLLAAPADAPAGFEARIQDTLWYVGCADVRSDLLAAGATDAQIDAALAEKRAQLGVDRDGDRVDLPEALARAFIEDLKTALKEEPEGALRRLDERRVDWITEYRVEIYSNESQHAGRPHVAVFLPDGKISVSLEYPPVILTPHGYRGEASAKRVVAAYRERLLKLWHETRPDDQKLKSAPLAAKPPK
jgi:hypothetical protein